MAIRKIVARSIGVDVITAEDLADNSITAAEITNGAVTTAKIADANVTTAKLATTLTVTHALGSASTPSITFTGDTNTGIFSPAADTLAFAEGGTETMRLTSAGDVGIGTTSPVNITGYTIQTINNASNGGGVYLQNNGTTIGRILNTATDFFVGGVSAGSACILQSGGAERMRIDSSGNVGIGTNSPTSGIKLDVVNSSASGTGAITTVRLNHPGTTAGDGPRLLFTAGASTTGGCAIAASGVALNSADMLFYAGGNTERMRLNSAGQLMINTTSLTGSPDQMQLYPSTTGSYQYGMMIGGNGTGFNVYAMRFLNTYTPAVVGSIYIGSTSTAFNTSSDYRLKENITPMTGALARVLQLKPCTYKWKADGSDGEGFIAHELAEVCPVAVTGVKDAVDEDGTPHYQGVDSSFLVATLTAAIQEQQVLITELKARLDAAGL